jgi:hypothetical protein
MIKMAKKDTGKITITLDRETVKKLRSAKRDMTWDDYMLYLLRTQMTGAHVECLICGRIFRSAKLDVSPRMLAEEERWTEVAMKGGRVIGFVCLDCIAKTETKEKKEGI